MLELKLEQKLEMQEKQEMQDNILLRPGFFLAESYGFISALLFPQAYTEYYYSIPVDLLNTNHDFFCDSKSLLKRIKRALAQS